MQLYEWRFRKSMEAITQTRAPKPIPDISASKDSGSAGKQGPAANHNWFGWLPRRLEWIEYRLSRTATRELQASPGGERPDHLGGRRLILQRLPPLF
jgi:hypothetical protein